MNKLFLALIFLSCNFVTQYFQMVPDYVFAITNSFQQSFAMLFIVFVPTLLFGGDKK